MKIFVENSCGFASIKEGSLWPINRTTTKINCRKTFRTHPLVAREEQIDAKMPRILSMLAHHHSYLKATNNTNLKGTKDIRLKADTKHKDTRGTRDTKVIRDTIVPKDRDTIIRLTVATTSTTSMPVIQLSSLLNHKECLWLIFKNKAKLLKLP